MKNSIKSLVLAGISSLALSPFAFADLEKYLPNEKTFAIVKIENIAALNKHVQEDALLSAFDAKILQPALAEVKGTSADWNEVFSFASKFSKYFENEAVLALVDAAEGGDGVFIADCADDFTPEKAFELIREAVGKDVKLVSVGKKSTGYKVVDGAETLAAFAIVDKKFVFSGTPKVLKRTVTSVSGKSKVASITTSPAFKKARSRIGDADIWFYADGASIAKKLYASAKAQDKETQEEMAEDPAMGMFAVQVTPIVKALAPEAIESVWASYTVNAKDDVVSESSLMWKENRGIVSLLTASLKNVELAQLPAIPLSDELASASAGTYSLGAFVSQAMVLARRASPLFGFVDMQLENLRMENIDVPALLKTLGNGMYSLTLGNDSDGIFAAKVDDEKLVIDTWNAFRPLVDAETPPPAPTTYEGVTVYPVDSAASYSSAFLNGFVCVGKTETLKKFIAQKNNPSIWDSAEAKAVLEGTLPGATCGVSYSHIGKVLTGALAGANAEMDKVADESGYDADNVKTALKNNPMLRLIRNLKISEKDFDCSVYSKTYLGENELTTKTVLIKNK